MKGLDTDKTDLTEQIDYTWTSGDLLDLTCVSTGRPEPEIHFMLVLVLVKTCVCNLS